MASLSGNTIASTFKALIKLVDNNTISASSKELTDGLGGGLGLHIDSAGNMHLEGDITADGLIDIRDKVDVVQSGTVVDIDFSQPVYNYHADVSGTWGFTFSNLTGQEGKAGNIVLNNTAATTPQALPTACKTPLGLAIDWVTTSGAVSIISYYVYSPTQVFINYLGDFK